MIKFINAFILIVLLIPAAAFGQKETKKTDKKGGAATDTIKVKADTTAKKNASFITLKPVMYKSLFSNNAEGFLLNKEGFYRYDYRSAGDYFYNIPFGFEQYLGSGGLSHETMIYGDGFGGAIFSDDGVVLNDRLSGSYDLNNFQTEKIDSIEVYPITKAFLYNPMNSSGFVNFISKDRVKEKQYSRLRFYEGSNKEGYIDFIYNMPLSRYLFLTTEITNNSIDARYINSGAGGWRASVKLRYNASEKMSFLMNYNYVATETKYNGGINLDSMKILYPRSWQEYFYNERWARVNFYYTGQKTLNHSISARMLSNFTGNTPGDYTVYFKYGRSEYLQNDTLAYEYDLNSGYKVIKDRNDYHTVGALVKQGVSYKHFDLNFIANYEGGRLNSPLLTGERKTDALSLSAVSTFHLADSTIHPSVFVKGLRYNSGRSSDNYPGVGGDVNISLLNSVYFYAGYSHYKKPYTVYEEEGLSAYGELPSQEIKNFEAGIRYIKKDYDIRLGYFNTRNNNYAVPVIIKPDTIRENNAGYYYTTSRNSDGLNLNIKYKYWKTLLTANVTTYLNRNAELVNSPSFTLDGGIYFVDTLFEKNLDLKAGFSFKFYTAQNFFTYDFERMISAQIIKSSKTAANSPILKTDDVFRVDFFLAGKVQDAAMVYFTFENLFDKQYYFVPYYPALGRNIRFGISWEFLD